jgi:hypothetical protein
VIITNIGQGQAIDALLQESGAEQYLKADSIVACYHERGSDELANRALKNFGNEALRLFASMMAGTWKSAHKNKARGSSPDALAIQSVVLPVTKSSPFAVL